MSRVRVRFAPSPTGPLNVGGLRTALYDYLFAKKHGGDFILRIEDTDANREVPGTEEYILKALKWAGIEPDEGPGIGGEYGPYKQSERKALYLKYAEELIAKGDAYYAFDTPEEVNTLRESGVADGIPSVKYNFKTRMTMTNSLTLSTEEVENLKAKGENVTIRLKMPEDEIIRFSDEVRGDVSFSTNELDDKIIMKADGMPTYHLANIVDDHLMEISHVIRGEEWLSSTAHHLFMYRSMGWEAPKFAHLSLILKPVGKGKLSKRDSAAFGFPVFPLDWHDAEGNLQFPGFKENGYLPQALINFLAFLGWNPGTDQEIFTKEELIKEFSLAQLVKSGARFDIDKCKWFNQQYILQTADIDILPLIKPLINEAYSEISEDFILSFIGLMKERVVTLSDFISQGYFFFEEPKEYEEKMIRKKYKSENRTHFNQILDVLDALDNPNAEMTHHAIKSFVEENELGFGNILPILRIGITGTMKGPDLFGTMALLGKASCRSRMLKALDHFDKVYESKINDA